MADFRVSRLRLQLTSVSAIRYRTRSPPQTRNAGAGPGDGRAKDAAARQQLTGMPGLVLVGYRPETAVPVDGYRRPSS